MTARPVNGAVPVAVLLLLLGGCTSSLPASGGARHTTAAAPRSQVTTTTRPSRAGPDGDQVGRAAPRGPVMRGWQVARVVDGDTVEVADGGRTLTLRLIGIDTPETVDPDEPVGCFGPQASAFAHRRLDGRSVLVELDRSQGRLDRYGRTLAYLWVGRNGNRGMYNLAALRRGYALEYTYDVPYAWRGAFVRTQANAERHHRGLWSSSTCDGDIHRPAQPTGGSGGVGSRHCAPGYRPCLPIRRDLDCSQIDGPVRVTGADQYGLDADGDGIACESS